MTDLRRTRHKTQVQEEWPRDMGAPGPGPDRPWTLFSPHWQEVSLLSLIS